VAEGRCDPRCAYRERARQYGFSAVELIVAVTVVLICAGVLLERLLFYQEAAEKARMELEVTALKLALQVQIGARIAEHQRVDYPALARENPVRWLDASMAGYRGEPGPEEAKLLPGGSWYFDRQALELVYLPRLNRYLDAGGIARNCVRFRVQLLRAARGARKDDPATIGLRLVPVAAYRWF
jgi:prepilin-type N-terminal cleavage/methylation domain-containing protein